MRAENRVRGEASFFRRLKKSAVVAALALGSLAVTGCDRQKMAKVAQLAGALASLKSGGMPGLPTSGTGPFRPATSPFGRNPAGSNRGMSNPFSGILGGNLAGIGPLTRPPGGGLPGQDSPGTAPKGDGSKAGINRLLEAAARRHAIPPDILKAVAYQESGWRADAKSFDGGHGKGVMQIDDRFHEFAKTRAVWDPAKNIEYGSRYLKKLYREKGTWKAALKRYNGGSDYPPKIFAHVQKRPWTRWV